MMIYETLSTTRGVILDKINSYRLPFYFQHENLVKCDLTINSDFFFPERSVFKIVLSNGFQLDVYLLDISDAWKRVVLISTTNQPPHTRSYPSVPPTRHCSRLPISKLLFFKSVFPFKDILYDRNYCICIFSFVQGQLLQFLGKIS